MSDDWTELYRPRSLIDVVGNPKAVKELKEWGVSWESGIPFKRAVVLLGPPGVGKTSSAIALANDMSWGLVEMNASEHRDGESIRQIAGRASISDTFTNEGEFLSTKEGRKKLIIMDEADNIFGKDDYGGVPALSEIVSKTKQPLILIVNDFYALSRKSSVIKERTLQIRFNKIQPATVKVVLRRVAADQNLTVSDRVLELLANNSNGDLRAAIHDLQAIGMGNPDIKEEQVLLLDNRLTAKSNYDLMAEIFHGTNPMKARNTMRDMQEDPGHNLLWIEENLPHAYHEPEDLKRGFDLLARADIFLARVSRRQYFRFWAYASDLMCYGVCAVKSRPYNDYVRYQFPMYLMKMSRNKANKLVRSSVSLKLGTSCHTSMRQATHDILPYFKWLYQKNKDFRLATTIDLHLEQEEAAYLLDTKVDSSAVKHLIQDLSKKRSGESDEHDLKPTKLEALPQVQKQDRSSDETKQKNLFEY
ncbi:MAG: replication factor C large subunit [Methanomassiliicoccales archaeon]|nr:replication factor C large subunit [Methanomassiliicoccales archaeon]